MLCELCKKNSAKYTTYVENTNNQISFKVCESCYDKIIDEKSAVNSIECEVCGATLGEIKQNFLVGCPNCYKKFSSYLNPVIEKVQKL